MKPIEDSGLHCEACSLIEDKQHRFAEFLATNGDRERAFYEAGYSGKDWRQLACRLLTKDNVWASFEHHREIFSIKTKEWGVELRELERDQSRANTYDLFTPQSTDSASFRHLETLFTEGVEVVEDGKRTFRPPTSAELRAAVHSCCELRMKAPDELTRAQQMQAESITIDPRGKVTVGTNRGAARQRSAKLEGLEAATQVKVEVNVSMEKWTLAFAAAVAAEAQALSRLVEELGVALNGGEQGGKQLAGALQALDQLSEAVPQLEARVLGRVG